MTHEQKPPPPADHEHPYEVVPGLYISGHPDKTSDFMTQGVHAVIDLEGDIDTAIPEREDQKGTTLYLYWPIEDGPLPDADTIRGIAAFCARLISNEGRKVLVHCRSGHNRSGLICARTLIELGKEPGEAISIVRDHRGDGHALSNETFVDWLQDERPPKASRN